jgi:AraC-like DNA-binding protein
VTVTAGTLIDRPPASMPMRSLVRSFWYCAIDLPFASERVLPIANVQLVFDLRPSRGQGSRAIVVGPATEPQTVATDWMRRSAGAVLNVAAARAVIGCPVRELRDAATDLSAIWGRVAQKLCDRLASAPTPQAALDRLEAELAARAAAAPAPAPSVRHAAAMLARGAPVGMVIDRIGMSRSTLVRRFDEEVGLSPKRWAGLVRFQRAVGLLAVGDGDLADIAACCGYADQAHMTRDFRRFGQVTPATYLPRSQAEPNHIAN